MERETRFELATSTLARLHSTTELFPHCKQTMRAVSVVPHSGVSSNKTVI